MSKVRVEVVHRSWNARDQITPNLTLLIGFRV
jgi:hypothetical protein